MVQAGRKVHYGDDAAACANCSTPVYAFFTTNRGRAKFEPCRCPGDAFFCYACLHDIVVLPALEQGRIGGGGVDDEDAAPMARCPLCREEPQRLLRLSALGNVTEVVELPFAFESAVQRRDVAKTLEQQNEKSAAWLRAVAPFRPPQERDFSAEDDLYRYHVARKLHAAGLDASLAGLDRPWLLARIVAAGDADAVPKTLRADPVGTQPVLTGGDNFSVARAFVDVLEGIAHFDEEGADGSSSAATRRSSRGTRCPCVSAAGGAARSASPQGSTKGLYTHGFGLVSRCAAWPDGATPPVERGLLADASAAARAARGELRPRHAAA